MVHERTETWYFSVSRVHFFGVNNSLRNVFLAAICLVTVFQLSVSMQFSCSSGNSPTAEIQFACTKSDYMA